MYENFLMQLDQNSPKLIKLDLSKYKLNLFQIAELSDALGKSSYLKSLKLSCLCKDSFEILCDVLERRKQKIPEVVVQLNLGGERIGQEFLTILDSAIKHHCLTSVMLNDCFISIKNIEKLLPAIEGNKSFHHLQLQSNFLAALLPPDNSHENFIQAKFEQLMFATPMPPNGMAIAKSLKMPADISLHPVVPLSQSGLYITVKKANELQYAILGSNKFEWLQHSLAPEKPFSARNTQIWLADDEIISYDSQTLKVWKKSYSSWQIVKQLNSLKIYFVKYWNGQLQIAHYGWQDETHFNSRVTPSYWNEVWTQQNTPGTWHVVSQNNYKGIMNISYEDIQCIPLINSDTITILPIKSNSRHSGIVGITTPLAVTNNKVIMRNSSVDGDLWLYDYVKKQYEEFISDWCVLPLWNEGLICAFSRQQSNKEWILSATLWRITMAGKLEKVHEYSSIFVTRDTARDSLHEPILLPDYSVLLQTEHALVVLDLPELKELKNKASATISASNEMELSDKIELDGMSLQLFRPKLDHLPQAENIFSYQKHQVPANTSSKDKDEGFYNLRSGNIIFDRTTPSNFFENNKEKKPNFLKTKPRMGVIQTVTENPWYSNDQIKALLEYYCQGYTEVDLLTPIPEDNQQSHFLSETLIAHRQQYQQAIAAGHQVKTKIILPLQIHGNHWVFLWLVYSTDPNQLPHIAYVDPYGYPMSLENRHIIDSIYPNVDIIESPEELQLRTNYDDCGPCIIEIARSLLATGRLPEKINFEVARQEHREVLKTGSAISSADTKIKLIMK